MRFINSLCPPALLYLIFTSIHMGLDLSLGRYATAAIKAGMAIAGVVILDALCSVELGIISWVIVGTPFIMVALASSIALGMGLDHMIHEKFSGLTFDTSMNRDKYVTMLSKNQELPLSANSVQ